MLWTKPKLVSDLSTVMLLVGGLITPALAQSYSTNQPFATASGKPGMPSARPEPENASNNLATSASNVDLSPTNILMKIRLAYALLSTYRDTAWTVHEYNGDLWTNTSTVRLGGRNCYRIEIITAAHPFSHTDRYWSDGLDNYHQCDNSTIFKGLHLENVSSTYDESVVPTLFFNLSWGNVLESFAPRPHTSLIRQADDKIGDVDCYVLEHTTPLDQTTLWVGKQDFLIRRRRDFISAEQLIEQSKQRGQIPPKSLVGPSVTTETHENIFVNEPFKRGDYSPLTADGKPLQ